MHSLPASIVLCLAAQAAAAQCVAAAPANAPARQGGELIATAAAGTRDAAGVHKVSAAAGRAPAQATDDDHPRRTDTAMLLTAVAIMSAIALRRAGMPRQ